MGWVLSKFRKSKSTMEVLTNLESDINNIIQFKVRYYTKVYELSIIKQINQNQETTL